MLASIFSDLHIHNYKQFDLNGSRLKNCLDVVDTIFQFNDRNGIKVTLFPGDLFHNQKLLPTSAVNETIRTFARNFQQYPNQKFIAISGNHDFATKNLIDQPGVSALEHLVEVFDRFILVDNYYHGLQGIDILGIPYYEYPEHYSAALDNAVKRAEAFHGVKVLMIHQTPTGTGDEFLPIDTDAKDERYKAFDYVYCGHIHERIQIEENFCIVGTPLQHNWNDAGKEKGFLVTDLSAPKEGYKFIPLGKYPKFIYTEYGADMEALGKHNFIKERPPRAEVDLVEEHRSELFRADLDPRVLLENFWLEVDGKDENLLKQGLKFI